MAKPASLSDVLDIHPDGYLATAVYQTSCREVPRKPQRRMSLRRSKSSPEKKQLGRVASSIARFPLLPERWAQSGPAVAVQCERQSCHETLTTWLVPGFSVISPAIQSLLADPVRPVSPLARPARQPVQRFPSIRSNVLLGRLAFRVGIGHSCYILLFAGAHTIVQILCIYIYLYIYYSGYKHMKYHDESGDIITSQDFDWNSRTLVAVHPSALPAHPPQQGCV